MNEILSLGRAARRFGVTQTWLRTEAKAGRVPHLLAGTRYLFDVMALNEALAARAGGDVRQDADLQQGGGHVE